MIGSLLADALPYLIASVVAALGVLGYGAHKERKGRAAGRDETYIETLRDSAKKVEKGREAVSDLRGNSRDDDLEQLRRNNAEW